MTSPLADTGITSPNAPSQQTLRSPSAWTPWPQSPQDGRTTDSTAAGPQKAADPQPHNGGSCTVKPPTKAWSTGGAQPHDRNLRLQRRNPRVNTVARPRGGRSRRRIKPSLKTSPRWRSGIGHRPRLRAKVVNNVRKLSGSGIKGSGGGAAIAIAVLGL